MSDRRYRGAAISDPIIPAHAATAQSWSTKAASTKGAAGAGFRPRQQYRSSTPHLEAKDAAPRRLREMRRAVLRETFGASGATKIRCGTAREEAGAQAYHPRWIDRGEAEEARCRRREASHSRCCHNSTDDLRSRIARGTAPKQLGYGCARELGRGLIAHAASHNRMDASWTKRRACHLADFAASLPCLRVTRSGRQTSGTPAMYNPLTKRLAPATNFSFPRAGTLLTRRIVNVGSTASSVFAAARASSSLPRSARAAA